MPARRSARSGSGAFGSWYAFTSATLVRAVPLIIIGLGIALAFRGGALNIGAEGQFYAGAIAATWVGLHVAGRPAAIAHACGARAPRCSPGGAWVAVPVWLQLRFGVLEVISTLLLNFVAESLVSLMVQGPLQESQHIYPQSDPIAEAARLPVLPGTRLHAGLLLALVAAAALWYVFARTLWGFRLRAVGRRTARGGDQRPNRCRRMAAVALLGSGALAGLAGGVEVSGVSYALFQNLSPGYGFTGIAVALLARLHPLGVVATGLLFGALEAGAGAMQRDAGVPAVAVYVVEAVVIVVVLLAGRRRRGGTTARGRGMTEPTCALVAGFLAAAVRVATPLLLAATGETVTERSGVINLGLEGMMLAGALAATLGATAGGPWTGLLAGVLAGMLPGGGCSPRWPSWLAADQIIAGTAHHPRRPWGSPGRSIARPTAPAARGSTLPTLAPIADSRPLRAFRCSGRPSSISRRRPTSRCSRCPWSGGCSSGPAPASMLRATGEGAAMARAAGVRTGLVRTAATIVGGGIRGPGGGNPGAGPGGHVRREDDGGARIRRDRDRGARPLASARRGRRLRSSSARRRRCSTSSSRWAWRCPTSSS